MNPRMVQSSTSRRCEDGSRGSQVPCCRFPTVASRGALSCKVRASIRPGTCPCQPAGQPIMHHAPALGRWLAPLEPVLARAALARGALAGWLAGWVARSGPSVTDAKRTGGAGAPLRAREARLWWTTAALAGRGDHHPPCGSDVHAARSRRRGPDLAKALSERARGPGRPRRFPPFPSSSRSSFPAGQARPRSTVARSRRPSPAFPVSRGFYSLQLPNPAGAEQACSH